MNLKVSKILPVLGVIAVAASTALGQFNDQQIVVANRSAGNISVIDVATNQVTNFDLPAAANAATPGYVVYSPVDDTVFVGDSANARIVAFDARTYNVVEANIPAGAGVFHMWGNPVNNHLWATNPADQTVSVIDMVSKTNLGTIDSPEIGGVRTTPHDVILDPIDGSGFVSYFAEADDFVVKYDAATYAEIDRSNVAEDPHLAVTAANNSLYVATQDGSQVEILDRSTLAKSDPITVPNAHGVTISSDGATLYTSSFPGASGVDGIHAIDTMTNMLVSSIDAPAAGSGPHNLALSSDNTRLYATHTGDSNLVSVYDVSGENVQSPVFLSTIETGANPFGVAGVPAVPEPSGLLLLVTGMLVFLNRRRN